MPDSQPTGTDRDTSFVATVKRTGVEFLEDEMTDRAAGLTYYGLLSLFPALIALVSIVGLFADPQATTEKLTEIVGNLGPDTAVAFCVWAIASAASPAPSDSFRPSRANPRIRRRRSRRGRRASLRRG